MINHTTALWGGFILFVITMLALDLGVFQRGRQVMSMKESLVWVGIWSGLAMSLGFVSAFPWSVTLLGGGQSARTIHFFVSLALVLFLFVHVAMVCLAGFWSRTGAMITGRTGTREEQT